MIRLIFSLVFLFTLAACGGGGGGSSDAQPLPEAPPTEPTPAPTALSLIDSQPAQNTAAMNPAHSSTGFAHTGFADLDVTVTADCAGASVTTIRRSLFDLSSNEFDQLLDHRIRCTFDENTSHRFHANGTRANDASFATTLDFSTGTLAATTLTVAQQTSIPRDSVDELFTGYVEGALLEDLDLPSGFESLLVGAIIDLAEANWDNLVDPEAMFDVVAQRVTFASRDPAGNPAILSGLVTFPEISTTDEFTPRDTIIVLTHATGSTPGDLDPADAWFILASQFASRGYLVIAPDNYGRGITDEAPETYLMANRTALNAADMIDSVLDSQDYNNFYAQPSLSIVGYSQGGHSAIGLWQSLSTQGRSDLTVAEVYAGGAPHNLYQTFKGVMKHIAGTCNDDAYCQFVDAETTIPFATDRILPGFLSYTNTGLASDDLVDGETIRPEFVTGFLDSDPQYDLLKMQFQLSTFTDILSAETNFSNSNTLVHLYHSEFDRLVPLANTKELSTTLASVVEIDFHENRCNADGYELIFNLTEKVGVLHTLCGLAVLDDAMEDLK